MSSTNPSDAKTPPDAVTSAGGKRTSGRTARSKRPLVIGLCLLTCLAAVIGLWKFRSPSPSASPQPRPVDLAGDDSENGGGENPGGADAGEDTGETLTSGPAKTVSVSLDDVLTMAQQALDHLVANVDDYTARMTKHERDRSGVLQEPSEMLVKIQTRHQQGSLGDPLHVYLKFLSPDKFAGREVIWVQDANDGKLLVREAGFVGTMMTAKLDPTGFLAMQGQRYPIHEIGLTNLIEKLIERGSRDRGNPEVKVTLTENYTFDDRPMSLIQIQRATPSDAEGDFSRAEVVIDPQRQLVVQFRSFGWPAEEAPLLESYTYRDIQLNPGLQPLDFDPANPEYTFPQ